MSDSGDSLEERFGRLATDRPLPLVEPLPVAEAVEEDPEADPDRDEFEDHSDAPEVTAFDDVFDKWGTATKDQSALRKKLCDFVGNPQPAPLIGVTEIPRFVFASELRKELNTDAAL